MKPEELEQLNENVNDEVFKGNCRNAIKYYVKLLKLKDIASILNEMYCFSINADDLADWCMDLLDKKFTIDEQLDKFFNMYKENYLTGFMPYIK